MPIFEFSCQKCGHTFEELLPSATFKAETVKCPACRSRQVKRGFSTFAQSGGGSTPASGRGGGGCGGGGFT